MLADDTSESSERYATPIGGTHTSDVSNGKKADERDGTPTTAARLASGTPTRAAACSRARRATANTDERNGNADTTADNGIAGDSSKSSERRAT